MRPLARARHLALPMLAVAAVACSSAPPPDSEPATGEGQSAIINGKASDATQDAVVLIVYPVGQAAFECTGSLLAPNLVLTARHCVSDTVDQPFEPASARAAPGPRATTRRRTCTS